MREEEYEVFADPDTRAARLMAGSSADPDRPAHLLAFMVVPAGEKLVLPA